LVGCDQQNQQQTTASPPKEIIDKLGVLTNRIDKLEKDLRSARIDIGASRFRISNLEQQYSTAQFDPASKGFQRVDANFGSFAVSLDDVKQFADGVKVRLNIGNLSSATFAGAKLSLRYGPRQPDPNAENYADAYSAWSEAVKSKDEDISQEIRPANWNPVQIALPGIAESKFGFLEVKIMTNHIQLYK